MRGAATAILAFIGGVAVGVITSRGYFKSKYKKEADEEIASVKEVFGKRAKKQESMERLSKALKEAAEVLEQKPEAVPEKEEKEPFVGAVKKFHDDILSEEKEEKTMRKDGPYVIKPSEYYSEQDYEKMELTYYADRVVTDEDEDVVEYPEAFIGVDFDKHFGEYEDDAVYIRNDERGCVYAVLRDQRSYAEVEDDILHHRWRN